MAIADEEIVGPRPVRLHAGLDIELLPIGREIALPGAERGEGHRQGRRRSRRHARETERRAADEQHQAQSAAPKPSRLTPTPKTVYPWRSPCPSTGKASRQTSTIARR